MPVNIPGTGAPDGEARPMPHGDSLLAGDTLTVLAGGTDLPGIAGNVAVAGYRSLVVAIHNTGAHDVTVTPKWDWNGATVALQPTQTKTVKAGAVQRLIFQNYGDLVDSIHLAGVGGGSTVDYYVTGSNLDPLPSSAPDYLVLTGIATAIPAVPGGGSGFAQLDETQELTNDASLWTYTLNGAGHITNVTATRPGRYEVLASFVFDPPSGAVGLAASVSMIGGLAGGQVNTAFIHTAFGFDGFIGGFTELVSGNLTVDVDYSLDANVSSVIRVQWFSIKSWAT